MKRTLMVLAVALALVAGACGASGDDGDQAEDEGTPTTEATTADAAAFGEMDEPVCGEGDLSVEPDEAGGSPDVLRIGVAGDRSSDIRPGLNKDMWDSSTAFAAWCNEQGGIGGLPIEIVDLDAALFNVEAAMTAACTGVFAMVGGGMVQDQLQFSDKEGSDFHKCAMIDIPGFANSPEKGDSNGQVQPLPNPGTTQNTTWFSDFQDLEPDAAEKWVVIWGELPSIEAVKIKYESSMETIGGTEIMDSISYPAAGADDWVPYAQKLIDSGATSFTWIGEPVFFTKFLETARQRGWEGTALLETNNYNQALLDSAEATEGTVVRTAFHPLEEADDWPATADYLEIVNGNVDDASVGPLGMQSFSAWLLFATAANACGEENDGVLDRTCILEQAAAVDEWNGGGLHGPQNPDAVDEVKASPCGMLLVVKDGEFVRLFPEVGGEGDDVDGFHCPEDGVTETSGTNAGVVDPDRPI
jgi:ABC-type branched-subunit amino acid transport system substrate-binding protein